jgi:hypothetical protein
MIAMMSFSCSGKTYDLSWNLRNSYAVTHDASVHL